MTWPPDPDALGAITIDVTPVIGGTPGDFLKVGVTGKLEQSPVSGIGMAIGEEVTGATPGAVLFVDAAGNLGEDPGFFDYDPATHTLKSVGDHQMAEFKAAAGTPTFNAWMGSAANGFGDPEPDQVFRAGWNLGAGSGNVNPAFGAVGFSIESYFRKGAPGTAKVQEFHLEHVTKAGAYRRYLSMEGNQETGELSLSLKGDDGGITFNTPDGLTKFGSVGTDYRSIAGGFLAQTYGAIALRQVNFAGSGLVPLVMLDTSAVDGVTHDVVQLGRGTPAWIEVLKPQHNNDLLLMLAGNGKGIYFDTVASGYRLERDGGGLALGVAGGAALEIFNGATLIAQFSGNGLDLRNNMVLDLSPIASNQAPVKWNASDVAGNPLDPTGSYLRVLVGGVPMYLQLLNAAA